jgi:hypothetical protein
MRPRLTAKTTRPRLITGSALIASSMLAFVTTSAAVACDGKAEVQAAFTAQHQKPWRTETAQKSDTGVEQKQQFDFQPPDRIYRKVTSGDETAETIGIGKVAWSNEGAGWQEMKKGLADIIATHAQDAFAPPRVSAEFKCLGPVTFEGKSYLGYQTAPEKVQDKELARTILVDPESRLPAFNIVADPGLSDEPLRKEAYSYPADINIEKPL